MKQSIKKLIQERIQTGNPERIYFSRDFEDLADNEQVRLALSRLVREKVLDRVSHGIYAINRMDPVFGNIRPSYEDVARAIAERDKITIKPTGSYALNRLGLSNQVPMKVVFMTNGESRKINVGKHTITFKKTTPKKMAYTGKVTPLIIEAIEELGEDGLTPIMQLRLTKMLGGENEKIVKENIKLAPRWIGDILSSMLKSIHRVPMA